MQRGMLTGTAGFPLYARAMDAPYTGLAGIFEVFVDGGPEEYCLLP